MPSGPTCAVYRKPLTGRQRKFCSGGRKNKDTNHRHQSYASQQARGLRRKCLLIAEAGGRCTRCGYSGNLAAPTWHHTNPAKKSFNLDMRALSNRSDGEVRAELAKCVLLCANCHAEEHFPDLRVMGPP